MAVNTQVLKRMSDNSGGPLTKEEIQLLRDFQGFIAYGIHEGLGFDVILRMLRHDIDGLVHKEPGFLPRVKGLAAELDRMASDPEVQREIRNIEAEFSRETPKAQ